MYLISLYSQQSGTGLYAATHSTFAFFGLDKFMDKPTRDAAASELWEEIKSSTLTTMDAAQYAIMAALTNDTKVGQLELIMYPGHFSATPPEDGKSYISILTALMVCPNQDNNCIDFVINVHI